MNRAKSVFDDAAKIEPMASLGVLWIGLNKAAFDAQQIGWAKHDGPNARERVGQATLIGSLTGVGVALFAFGVPYFSIQEPVGTVLRLKLQAVQRLPLNALGHGEKYSMEISRDGWQTQIDKGTVSTSEQLDSLIGANIAHEFYHAIGGLHCTEASRVDSAAEDWNFKNLPNGPSFYSNAGREQFNKIVFRNT